MDGWELGFLLKIKYESQGTSETEYHDVWKLRKHFAGLTTPKVKVVLVVGTKYDVWGIISVKYITLELAFSFPSCWSFPIWCVLNVMSFDGSPQKDCLSTVAFIKFNKY